MMTGTDIDQILGDHRVVATVTIGTIERAVPVAAALVDGGVPAVEVMLRTDVGLAALETIVADVPDAVVGAGTVLTVERLEQAAAAGAAFAVSPGFDPALADRAAELGVPFLPGAITPTEIQACLARDISTVKFFPASTAGGPAAIKALAAAYSFAGVQFVPTGGVDDTTIDDYLAVPAVRAVGMSWIASSAAVRDGDFEGITSRARSITDRLRRQP